MIFFIVLLLNFSAIQSGVVELTDKDFDLRMKGKNAMVMFYSPNCGHCQRMKPAYESLGNARSVSSTGVLIARVDCTAAGKKTCSKYGVSGFPTVKFISRTEPSESVVEYDGNRELSDLTTFVLDNNRPAFTEISDKDIQKFIDSSKLPVVIGFFKDAKSKLYTKLTSIANEQKLNFLIGVSFSEKAAKSLDQKMESVVIFRQNHLQSKLEEKAIICVSDKDLPSCLKKNRFSIVEYRDRKNHDSFHSPQITAFIGIDPFLLRSDAKRLRSILVKSAQKNKDLTFTISRKSEFDHFVADIAPHMKEKDVVLVAIDKDDYKYVAKSISSIDDPKGFETILDKFVTDFKKGNVLERFVKSQPADTPNDGNVRVVVAHTFQHIVVDNDKDVLVEFYAPWCGHCKKLTPIYQQLATLLKDEKNLIIAKYDATANEAQKNFGVEGFPTIYLAKAGKKSSPIQYQGKRETKDMLEWLKKNTKNKILFNGDIPPVKEEL